MPETPDFDQIATRLLVKLTIQHSAAPTESGPQIAEQLRLVWNARGAADLETLEPFLADERRAIRNLDR